MEGHFALRLTFVLEPYSDGFYFPGENASGYGASHVGLENDIHSCRIRKGFAFLSRRMGCPME